MLTPDGSFDFSVFTMISELFWLIIYTRLALKKLILLLPLQTHNLCLLNLVWLHLKTAVCNFWECPAMVWSFWTALRLHQAWFVGERIVHILHFNSWFYKLIVLLLIEIRNHFPGPLFDVLIVFEPILLVNLSWLLLSWDFTHGLGSIVEVFEVFMIENCEAWLCEIKASACLNFASCRSHINPKKYYNNLM